MLYIIYVFHSAINYKKQELNYKVKIISTILLTILFNTHALPKEYTTIESVEILENTLVPLQQGESIWIVIPIKDSNESEIFEEMRSIIKSLGFRIAHCEIQRELPPDQNSLLLKRFVIQVKKL